MPGFVTHYICGQAVLNAVDLDARKMISPYHKFYNLGTQGPDIFFYYLPGLVLKKHMRDIGIKMHKSNFGTYMAHMIDIMMDKTTSEPAKNILMAYISGYLTHYELDATAHPYVYSKTGMRKKGDKAKAIKYSVNHRKLETAIDSLMLELLSSKKPAEYKLWELMEVDRDPAQIVAGAMSISIQEAFDRNISAKDIYKAMTYMIKTTKILQSLSGKRKRFRQLMENLTIGDHLYSSIIQMQEATDGVDYMNMGKSRWKLPGTEERNDSFVELYQESVKQGIYVINTLAQCVKGEVSREKLAVTLGNRSLATGLTPEHAYIMG